MDFSAAFSEFVIKKPAVYYSVTIFQHKRHHQLIDFLKKSVYFCLCFRVFIPFPGYYKHIYVWCSVTTSATWCLPASVSAPEWRAEASEQLCNTTRTHPPWCLVFVDPAGAHRHHQLSASAGWRDAARLHQPRTSRSRFPGTGVAFKVELQRVYEPGSPRSICRLVLASSASISWRSNPQSARMRADLIWNAVISPSTRLNAPDASGGPAHARTHARTVVAAVDARHQPIRPPPPPLPHASLELCK